MDFLVNRERHIPSCHHFSTSILGFLESKNSHQLNSRLPWQVDLRLIPSLVALKDWAVFLHSCPKEFFVITEKKPAIKTPTHLINSAFKLVKMATNYQKSLLLLHLVSEIRLEQYWKENTKGSCPNFVSTIFILMSNKSHHIFQTILLSLIFWFSNIHYYYSVIGWKPTFFALLRVHPKGLSNIHPCDHAITSEHPLLSGILEQREKIECISLNTATRKTIVQTIINTIRLISVFSVGILCYFKKRVRRRGRYLIPWGPSWTLPTEKSSKSASR